MAIIEIAKIQVRRGQEGVTGLPQLDSGEFGWALDAQNLYIGNGSLAEGAPSVGNTRILTEHDSNLFSLTTGSSYVYLKDDAGQHRDSGINLYTDMSGSDYTYRKISDKLNDFTTIFDFGGVNGNFTDNTQILQNAIDQIWLNSDKNSPRGRVALRIPAGTYLISDTIYIPPYTTLIGDGQDKTVLILISESKSILQTCDSTSSPGNYVSFQEGSTNITDTINNINLIGITFEYATGLGGPGVAIMHPTLPLVRFDCATDSQIIDCKFNGYYPFGTNGAYGSSITFCGLELRGQGALATKDLLIKNCTFDGFIYDINSDYDIQDVVIDSCIFRNSNTGIVGAQSLGAGNQTGPVRTKIQNSKFINIEREAIYFYSNGSNIPTHNISTQNTFQEVGNSSNGDFNPTTAILNFQSSGNRSINDYFDRFDIINADTSNPNYPYFRELVDGHSYQENTSIVQHDIQGGIVLFAKFPIAVSSQSLKLQYSIRKAVANISRQGELHLNVSVTGDIPSVALTETYSYNGANNGMIEFSVSANTLTNTLNLSYMNSGTGEGIISYKYSQLQ